MAKNLETGKDKIQRICDTLRKETLDPARQEAAEILENAHLQAADIVREAQGKAETLLQAADRELAQKRAFFDASMKMACRQGIESLKQKIEEELFHRQLSELVAKEMADPKLIASLLTAFIKALESKGIEEDLEIFLPKHVSQRAITSCLAAYVLEKLQAHPVVLADFEGRKFAYSPYLRPMMFKDMQCVAIKHELEVQIPDVFNFLMQFARDNQLVVTDCANFKLRAKI